MIGLQSIGAVLSDPELRKMFADVASRKVKADLKTLEAHAELSRRLADNRQNARFAENGALKRIVRQHLEYYGTLIQMSYSFHDQLLHSLKDMGGRGDGEAAINALTLSLSAVPGATVRAPFKVSNNRPEPITVTCRASPFVSEDGTQLIGTPVAFDPPGAEIAPGSEQIFTAIIAIGPDFRVGRTYFATLSAEGIDSMQIITRLTIEQGAQAAQASPAAPPPVAVADVVATAPEAVAEASGKEEVIAPAAPKPAPAARAKRVAPEAGGKRAGGRRGG